VSMCCTRVSILFVLTARHIEEMNGEVLLGQTYVRTLTPLPTFEIREDYFRLNFLAPKFGCARAILIAAKIVVVIKIAGDL